MGDVQLRTRSGGRLPKLDAEMLINWNLQRLVCRYLFENIKFMETLLMHNAEIFLIGQAFCRMTEHYHKLTKCFAGYNDSVQ